MVFFKTLLHRHIAFQLNGSSPTCLCNKFNSLFLFLEGLGSNCTLFWAVLLGWWLLYYEKETQLTYFLQLGSMRCKRHHTSPGWKMTCSLNLTICYDRFDMGYFWGQCCHLATDVAPFVPSFEAFWLKLEVVIANRMHFFLSVALLQQQKVKKMRRVQSKKASVQPNSSSSCFP